MILELITILLIAVILAAIFFYGFKRPGPWGSFWSFLLILILSMLLFTVWTEPYGPVYRGIGWIDLLIIGLLFALLLAAASPPPKTGSDVSEEEILPATEPRKIPDRIAVSGFFWILILLFIVLIIFGLWG